MPRWSEILSELYSDSPPDVKKYDQVRRDYLLMLSGTPLFMHLHGFSATIRLPVK